MAHIKCRYDKEYCGCKGRLRDYQKPCDPEKGDTNICACSGFEYDKWNTPSCEHLYYCGAEFETITKKYEFEDGERPVLIVGNKYIDTIVYLEIDGRVLIDKEGDTK